MQHSMMKKSCTLHTVCQCFCVGVCVQWSSLWSAGGSARVVRVHRSARQRRSDVVAHVESFLRLALRSLAKLVSFKPPHTCERGENRGSLV
jgi:hypothetical protein